MYQLRIIFFGLFFAFFSHCLINPAMFSNPVKGGEQNASTRMSASKPVDEKLGGGVKTYDVGIGAIDDSDDGPGGY